MSDVNKVVLAYSGGLDTSVILKWLQDTYQCEVVTFTADLDLLPRMVRPRRQAHQFGDRSGAHLFHHRGAITLDRLDRQVKVLRHHLVGLAVEDP